MRPCWSGERTGSTTSLAVRCHGRREHRCDGSISTPLRRKPGGGEQRCLKEAAMRAAVIGAGGVGSAAARFLATAGHKVTVLEQFAVDHDRGSSYGQSRVIRRVYPDVFYTMLMEHSYRLWRELEAEAGESLLLETGGLFFGPAEHPEMRGAEAALREAGVPFEVWNARRTAERVVPLRMEAGEVAISQGDTGILRASRCVRANVRLARSHGAQVQENNMVAGFEGTSEGIRLTLADG